MSSATFSEYSWRVSNNANEAQQKLPAEAQRAVVQIICELAENPQKHPERLICVNRTGTSWLYRHPHPPIEVIFEIDLTAKILDFHYFSFRGMPPRQTVFISYSHKDKGKWLDLVRPFLKALEDAELITLWEDSKILAGERWEDEIKKALDSSRAAVLLVSQNFLTSEFITKVELPQLLAGAQRDGKKILWIPLSPSTVFDDPRYKEITDFQSPLPDPRRSLADLTENEQQQALVELHRRIQEALRVSH